MARFGDIVLLLPALKALKTQFPESRLTFLTDNRWAPLAEMCPAIDEIISVDRIGMKEGKRSSAIRNIGRLAEDLRHRKFDLAIDFHGFRETNLLAWWTRAPQRLGLQRYDQSFLKFCFNLPPVVEDKTVHVSEMFLRIVRHFGDISVSGSALIVPERVRQWAADSLPRSPVVLFMGAPVPERVWSPAAFARVADHMIRTLGAPVIAVPGPDQGEDMQEFLAHTKPSESLRVLSGLSIPELTAVIGSARLLISNDTGPMHLGPALGIPTLGIFSVGLPVHFRPTGIHDRYIQENPIGNVRVEDVIAVADEMLAAASRR